MRGSLLRWLAIVLLINAIPLLGLSQEKLPVVPPTTDRFVGMWKLNVDKSSRSGIDKESISITTVESEEKEFKFVFDSLGDNRTELRWWFVTDMKGGVSKHTQVNGRPMTSESCITRLDSDTFVDDTKILKDEYKVSADGQTLTVRRNFKQSFNGKKLPDQKLVFDRLTSIRVTPD
jgi:hypothetical protein